MPLTLICRRCGSEVLPKDVFCQECGMTQDAKTRESAGIREFSGSGTSDFDWPALEADPLSQTPIDNRPITSLFGQTYDFSNYQVDLSSVAEDLATDFGHEYSAASNLNSDSADSTLTLDGAEHGGAFGASDLAWVTGSADEIAAELVRAKSPASESAASDENAMEQGSAIDVLDAVLDETTSKISSVSANNATKATATASGTQSISAGKQKLHSPLFDDDKARDNNLGMRGGLAMVLIDNALVIAIVCFVTALSFYGYKLYKQAEVNKETQIAKSISEKVKSAAIKEDYEGIYKQLNNLRTAGKTELVERQQALFDEAVFRLGQREIESGKPDKAIDYLKQVSLDSDHYIRARELIFQQASPVVASSVVEVPGADDTDKSARKRRRRGADANLGYNSGEPVPISAGNRVPISENPVLSIPVIPELEKYNQEESNQEAGAGTSSPGTSQISSPADLAATRKFSESDISQYNRLLAEYFAKHSNKTKEENSSEVPAFREWLKQGKPSF